MMIRVASIFLAGSLIVGAGSLGYMASQRSAPIEVLERTVNSASARPGGEIIFTQRVVQRRHCHIHIDRYIFDSADVRFILPPLEFQAGLGPEIGKELRYAVKVPIPHDMSYGPARYEALAVYRCNLLHGFWPIYQPYGTLHFEVSPI